MSWFKDFFKPRQDNFTRLLIEQAAWVVKGLEALNAYMVASEARPRASKAAEAKGGEAKNGDVKGGDAKAADAKPPRAARSNIAQAVEAVRRCEEEADEVRRILISELNRTFVAPMDREDIFALSRAIDDILDYAWSTVQEMELLHVTPTPYVHRMVSLLGEAAHEVHMAMLRIKDHPEVATEHAQRAKALENRVEHVYREALADLFDGPAGPKRVIWILKMREIYRHLSNAADRGDAAANIIYDIVVKMT
ncbi:MAG: DUF47 family protein [Anaerolineae bacterium]|nr:DUF47 family protein [Anaerolineae bacterium]